MARLMLDDDDDNKLKKDALIYQKRNTDTTKDDIKNMNVKGKWQFFKDYYLKSLLIGILIVGVIIYYVGSTLNKPQTVLYVAIADDLMDDAKVAQMEKDMETYLGLDGKKQVVSIKTDYSSDSLQSSQQIQTYLYSGSCDIVIADKDGFTTWAQGGYFLEPDTSDIVSFYKDYPTKDRLYSKIVDGETFRGEKDQDDTEYNFGIHVSNSKKYKEMGGLSQIAYAGIANSSEHQEEARAFLEYMLNDNLKSGDVNPDFVKTK